MELLQRDQLKSLIEESSGPCVSIFLPTHRGGAEVKQSPIRLKNLLKEAEKQLSAKGLKAAQMTELLDPAQKLCENSGFWRYQSNGLAIFRSPQKFLYFRLPLKFDDLLVVADRFHVKPVMQLFVEDGRFYVLSLSKHEVRLYQCTRYGVREVDLPPDTPRSLDQVLQTAGLERQTQVQTAGTSGKYHRHGTREEDEKEQIKEFFRLVDRGVKGILRDDPAPMVLAAVEYLLPLYRAANTHAHLVETGITGNPEGRRPEELQADAWRAVEPHLKKLRIDAARKYADYGGPARVSNDIRVVLPATTQGRVESLFVAAGKQLWGRFQPDAQAVVVNDQRQVGDEELLDAAAIQTYLQGGAVYAVAPEEVPGGNLLAAVFRF